MLTDVALSGSLKILYCTVLHCISDAPLNDFDNHPIAVIDNRSNVYINFYTFHAILPQLQPDSILIL